MSIFSRRPRPSETAKPKPETEELEACAEQNGQSSEEEIPTFEQDGIVFARLITAADNGEEAVIESILISANIPYVIREQSSESWMRVMMGYNFFGVDFYVPENMLDDAAALLIPDDEDDETGDNGEDGEE